MTTTKTRDNGIHWEDDVERETELERERIAREDLVIVEIMPDQYRESHRAARNWGRYPDNGAERSVMPREDAEELVCDDYDGYTRIVRSAEPGDL